MKNFMETKIRQIQEFDFKETENLTRETFWNLYKPGCDEHLVLHEIRKSNCYIRELDLIMTAQGEIIGHIICSKAKVVDSMNKEHHVLCVGPFSIVEKYQRKGYGSKLMEYCIERSKESDFPGMVLFGAPDYYHRFGFKNAAEYGISTKEGLNFDPFMAKELKFNGLKDVHGRFFEDEAFSVNQDELNEFEKQFPPKEKRITSTQLKM
jgi:predicted N-acetyltransferase YhbS